MATELEMSGWSVGNNLKSLKEKLPDSHFIRQIKSSEKKIGGKIKRIYHFKGIKPQILKPGQEKIKEYFEDIGEQFFLDGGHIIAAEMATELGMKSGRSVGRQLSALKKKLPNDHFIHKIKSNDWWIRGKTIYYFDGIESQILTPEQENIKEYFEDKGGRVLP